MSTQLNVAANLTRLIEMIHQAFRIYHNLQELADQCNASLRTQMDEHLLRRETIRESLINQAESPSKDRPDVDHQIKRLLSEGDELQQTAASIQRLSARCNDLDTARGCIRKTMTELSEWRRLINKAVEAYDESVRHVPKD